MRLNADFSRRAIVSAAKQEWRTSPESGVDRLMLDRVGDEVARATSVVRYRPGSRFASHAHAKGEEFLVLDGTFSDETGDYPAGTYVRNPPGSSHAPFSEHGCRILVKLRQFAADDLQQFAIDTRDERAWSAGGVVPLHRFGSEHVSLHRFEAESSFAVDPSDGGTELFVVRGALSFEDATLPAESWLRFPPGDSATCDVIAGTTLWIKTGHLRDLVR